MVNLVAQTLYDSSTTQQHNLGTLGQDKYGNRFRYVKAGSGGALVAGNLIQEGAEDTNFRSMVCAEAAAIGATSIKATLGGTAVTANLFGEGSVWIESSTGIGQRFRVKAHDVQASTTGTLTITLDRPLTVAITTSSQITIRKNPYAAVIQYPVTTQTGGAVGAALTALAASSFGWLQSGGDTCVLFDTGSNTANEIGGVVPSAAVAGSVKVAAETDAAPSYIGFSREVASVDSTIGYIHMTID